MNAITTQDAHPLVVLRSELEQRAAEFKMVLPAHISPDKLQRTILTSVQANPDLLKCDRRSFITAAFKAAQDGLLPDGREAALVQFNTRQKIDGQWQSVKLAQYMPMVFGLRKKILQSGEITDIFASVVYRQEIEGGRFIYEEGTQRMLRHKPLLDADFDPQDDDIALAYSVATFADGSKSFEVMRRSEINKVRQASQTGATGKTDRQGNAIEPKGPWVDWFAEMAKKTVLRRHSKSLPMSGDVFADVEGEDIDNAARSAAALLSTPGGEPERIEDHTDETPHDPDTGEIIDADASEPDDSAPAADEQPKAEEPATAGEPQPEVTAASTDELGVTRHPAEEKADEVMGEIRDATAIIDVNSIVSRHREDIDSMPDEIATVVRQCAEVRKSEIKAERETAKSEAAE